MSVRLAEALAVCLGRLTHWSLHEVLHRSASQLPGRVALALDKNVLADLAPRMRAGSVVVCGTNGKTTTTNLIASAVEATGARILCNREGANMAAGVATALLADGAADWAVLEADELSTTRIVPSLQPRYLVLLNLFRDQLDRAGEIDHVQDTLVEALGASPNTTLVTCGDDPLCMGVARRAAARGTRVLTFGLAEDLGLAPDRVPEARFCQVCGAELAYEYRSYAQLGAFRCPSCDFARPKLDFYATDVNVGRQGVSFALSGLGVENNVRLRASFGGVYMVYNLMAACVAATLMGVEARVFQHVLDGYHPHNGRLQRYVVNGREVLLNLAKNPTGFNQNISLLLQDEQPKAALFVINDDYNDGRDISWIWDVDFERLANAAHTGVLHVMAGGRRAYDVRVRMKYAGLHASAPMAMSVGEALSLVADLPANWSLYVLCNYSALEPAKQELDAMGGTL